MNPLLNDLSALTEIPPWLLAIVITWSLVWKGLALWKSAKRNSSAWFIAILVINTIGIFEILYIYLFSEIKLDNLSSEKKRKKIQKKPARRQKAFLDN